MSASIPFYCADDVRERTPWPLLIEAIGEEFRSGCNPPERQQHEVAQPDGASVRLLLMPAWGVDGSIGVKLSTIAQDNARRQLPTINGLYIFMSAKTGLPKAILDAGALTSRRTAAASALACDRLARQDAKSLLVVGTGRLARNLARAHSVVRPLTTVFIWGRNYNKARELSRELEGELGVRCVAEGNLEAAAVEADIISTATYATKPLILGNWVRPGIHLDLVGAFTPMMREVDSDTIRRADQVFIDTLEGARAEAGDLIQAERDGVFSFDSVSGDLFSIAGTGVALRNTDQEITLYKSVGSAQQDLAAARLCIGSME